MAGEDYQTGATPTDPKDLFSHRYTKGLGVAHRHHDGVPGTVALFGNMGAETLNFQNFCSHFMDFFVNDDVDTTNRWTMTSYLVGCTFIKGVSPNGLALFNTPVTAQADEGGQLQENVVSRHGKMYQCSRYVPLIAWEWRGYIPEDPICDWFVGLSETIDPFMDPDATINSNNYIGFLHVEDTTQILLVQGGNGSQVVAPQTGFIYTPEHTGGDPPHAYHTLGLRLETTIAGDPMKMTWHVDGRQVGAVQAGDVLGGVTVADITAAMCSTIAVYHGNGTPLQVTVTMDYIMAQMRRAHAGDI